MKRVIKKYDHNFVKENGDRIYFTSVEVPFSDVPEDCDFSGVKVGVVNVLYDDCCISVRGFDDNGNILHIKIPKTLQYLLYVVHRQGRSGCLSLLKKLDFEEDCIKNKKEIGYDNTVA